jgi:MinD superfamily P-loop ATPase
VLFLDCDVEAPNAHLFLRPQINQQQEAVILLPHIDPALCTACGKCVEVCQFHALALIGKKVLVFPQLCHGCGSCGLNCLESAISEKPNPIGLLEAGQTETGIHFAHGTLTISEPMPTPIIRQLKRWKQGSLGQMMILDAPPGASCSVVETLRGSDFVLLVTEPTPFGLHDLKQMLGILREMNIPAGVVINRDGIGDGALEAFCAAKNLPILLRIPFDRQIAEGVSQGKTLVEICPEFKAAFQQIVHQIQKE